VITRIPHHEELYMNLKELVGKEITVISDGLKSPCGGAVIDVSETLITLKPNRGNNNILVIPINRIASILCIDGGMNNGRSNLLQNESLASRDEKG
jgi:hypothetical protein